MGDGGDGSGTCLGLDDGLPVVRTGQDVAHGVLSGLLVGQMILGGAIRARAVGVGDIICVAALREVDGVAVAVDSVPVGPDGGESAHGLIPAGGGDGHLGAGVQEDCLGLVVPRTSQPHVGLLGIAGGGDGAVVEHISPLDVGPVRGCHDISAALAVDVESGVVDIDVAAVVDEVHGTLDERVAHVCAIV